MIYCVGSPSACTQADTGRPGPASAHHTSILSLSYIPNAPSDSHGCSLYCIFVHFFLILSGKCQGRLLAAGRSDMVSLFADGRTTSGRGSLHPPGQPDRQPDFPARSASRIAIIFSCGWRHCHPFSRQKWRPGIHVGCRTRFDRFATFLFSALHRISRVWYTETCVRRAEHRVPPMSIGKEKSDYEKRL